MRSRARAESLPQDQVTTQVAGAPPQRRLPVILLALLSLVLGGALLVVAITPAPSVTATADHATALAAALARGEAAMAAGAREAPLGRALTARDLPTTAATKARTALEQLAVEMGGRGTVVALLDPAGRARLAHGAADGGAAALLPGGVGQVERLLGSRPGGIVQSVAADRVVFATPIETQNGTAVGVLVASVPADALLGPRTPRLTAGAVVAGSAAGTTWVATGGGTAPGSPLPTTVLMGLAALALLALPLAWLANRPPRARGVPAAASPAPTSAVPGSGASPAVHAPAPAQRLPAYQAAAALPAAPPVPAMSAGTATGPAADPATVAPPASLSAADAAPARRGRLGLGRRRAEPAVAAVTPVIPEAPAVIAAASPEELLDSLTGLGNQRGFGEEMDRLMVSWERNRVPFAVLLLDVDDLRITNARAGHTAGDEVLRTLGRHVKAMLRFSDRAYRVGGDEVALLLPHTDAAGAVQLGQRLLSKVRGGAGGEPGLAFSAGAAAFPGPAQDRDQLMDQANAALAWGKAHGRASVLAYDPATHAAQTDAELVAQAAAVAQVIAERTLRAVFQPIVDMQTGDVVGYEGLTRPTPGALFTNPGQLFEAAERVGRTVELDAACFETIAQGARAIPPDRVVTINLSPRTMEAADFSVSNVLEVLRSHDLDPGRVVLELTERESVLDLDRLRDNLAELQRAGVRIAADDVGAGNAGLRLLSQFRFDIVKVDLGLVQEGANNEASQAVLRSLRDLAQRWGAFVIAEGIETPTQLKVVRELGLSAGQGYLIGRPGTIVDLPPVDLDGLCEGGLMLQNAPVPTALPHGSPA